MNNGISDDILYSEVIAMNKRTLDPLPEEEWITIQEMHQNHPKKRLRQRALMVILSCKGISVKLVAEIVQRSENTVSTWLSAYKSKGFLGLYDQPIPGRPPGLSQQGKHQINERRGHNPDEY